MGQPLVSFSQVCFLLFPPFFFASGNKEHATILTATWKGRSRDNARAVG